MRKERINERLSYYQERLNLYLKAERAILEGAQHYELGTRKLTRADLSEIRKMISELEAAVDETEAELSGNGRRKAVRVIPRDI